MCVNHRLDVKDAGRSSWCFDWRREVNNGWSTQAPLKRRACAGPNATCLRCTARVLLLVWTLIIGGSNQCGCIEGGFKRIATEATRTTRQAVAAGVHPYLGQNQCH